MSEPGTQITLHSGTIQATSQLNRVSDQKWTLLSKKTLDPIAGSPVTGKSVAGIISLFVGDLFGTGENEMEQRVLARLRKDLQVGSEDWNDVTFTRQRIRWTDPQSGSCIEAYQQKAIEELGRDPSGTKHERRSPLYPCNAHNVQKSSGTDNLDAGQHTISVLLQVFQMCLNGSFTNNWVM